jgi:hypothetical protein
MNWFGPSKDEVWQLLSQEIGAEFVKGGLWKGNKFQAHVKPWSITLDTYTVSTGKSHVTYTRMRAPYINPEGASGSRSTGRTSSATWASSWACRTSR